MYIIYMKYCVKNKIAFLDASNKFHLINPMPDKGYLKIIKNEYYIINKNECDKFKNLSDVYKLLSVFFNSNNNFLKHFNIIEIRIEKLKEVK